jgi:hypothetical protein
MASQGTSFVVVDLHETIAVEIIVAHRILLRIIYPEIIVVFCPIDEGPCVVVKYFGVCYSSAFHSLSIASGTAYIPVLGE